MLFVIQDVLKRIDISICFLWVALSLLSPTLTAADTTPPTITCPADFTVECQENSTPQTTGQATATDDTDPNPIVSYSDVLSTGTCIHDAAITRTWTATDLNNNFSSCDQAIAISDLTSPSLTIPADITLDCDQPTDPNTAGLASAADNCSSSANVENGLVLYYPFNSDTSVADDESNEGNDGTYTGGAAYTGSGYSGGGGSLDGVNDYIQIADDPSLRPAHVSVSMWINPQITYSSGYTIFFTKEQNGSAGGYILRYFNGNLNFTVMDSSYHPLQVPYTFTAGQWVHIGGTYDGVNHRLYIDGALVAEQPLSITLNHTSKAPRIGCTADPTPSLFFQGTIDDVRVYNRGLSSSEMQSLYAPGPTVSFSDSETAGTTAGQTIVTRSWTATDACGNNSTEDQVITTQLDTSPPTLSTPADVTIECNAPTCIGNTGIPSVADDCLDTSLPSAGLLLYYPFDSDEGATVSDASGNNRDGTLTGATWSNNGPYGGAMYFDNLGDLIETSDVGLPSGSSHRSFSWWFKLDHLETELQTYMMWYGTAACNQYNELVVDWRSNRHQMGYAYGCAVFNSSAKIDQPNCWYHAVLTYEAGNYTWYLNGVETSGNSELGNNPPSTILNGTLKIGVNSVNKPLNGYLDEIRIYDRALTPIEVTQLHQGSAVYSDVFTSGSCQDAHTITRTWSVSDPSSNQTSQDQIITVLDTTPPTISCPPDVHVELIGDIPAPNINDVTTSDNCGSVNLAHVGDSNNGGSGTLADPYLLTRTYQATDPCNNSVTCEQGIRVHPFVNIETDLTTLPVDEGSSATFSIRLTQSPASSVTISVERISGSDTIEVADQHLFTFNDLNWSDWQTVTIGSSSEPDSNNDTATFQCSGYYLNNVDVIVNETDLVTQNADHYVNEQNLTPAFPYETWATAATSIQLAVDAARAEDHVWVEEGLYSTGGAPHPGATLFNRVMINKTIHLESVNGPGLTTIKGESDLGASPTRCVYITSNATISGFTLTEGHTVPVQEVTTDSAGGGVLLHQSGIVSNCIIKNSSAVFGGGANILFGNGQVLNCIITNNLAIIRGGGVFVENGAGSLVLNCKIQHNNSMESGGGIGSYLNATFNNCLISHNEAATISGGAHITWGGSAAFLNNCTIVNNTAPSTGGLGFLSSGANVNNCIIYDNENGNWDGNTLNNSCTTPLPVGGVGNISDTPQFIDPMAGDFRLEISSPCVDTGANQGWMTGAQDLNGTTRILNSTVDMGAYELEFAAMIKIFLQGPYDEVIQEMSKYLGTNNHIPLQSPYGADQRTVTAIPSDVTDWILIELRDATTFSNVFVRSAFLGKDGSVLNDQGASGIIVEPQENASLYLVIKHRNHIVGMSAAPILFNTQIINYDFTTSINQFYGAPPTAIELEPGAWGLAAGDADGDGFNLPVDLDIHQTQLGFSGYHLADYNLDGQVAADDSSLFGTPNQGLQASFNERAAVNLRPALYLSPPRKTMLPGETLPLEALNHNSVPVHWHFVENNSGASLDSFAGSAINYSAGPTAGVIDVVEAWDDTSRLGRVYINVISPADVASFGKAIIIASGNNLEDPVWDATKHLALNAYTVLRHRGYSHENINYLSYEPGADEFIDSAATENSVEAAFTDLLIPGNETDKLFIYLVDHGGNFGETGFFRIDKNHVLLSSDLAGWLKDIQLAHDTDITLVMDFCYAGTFIAELNTYTGPADRTVITATRPDQLTYFISNGQNSFSSFFFNGIYQGQSVLESYALAKSAMASYQDACLDDDKDGIADHDDPDDGLIAGNTWLGSSFLIGKNYPIIGSSSGNQVLNDETSTLLWVDDIASEYDIQRVWCTIIPPNYNIDNTSGIPITEAFEIELFFNPTTGRYEAEFNDILENGKYVINMYAEDIWLSISPPETFTIVQNSIKEAALIIAGAAATGTPEEKDSIWRTASLVYKTFADRFGDDQNIVYLNTYKNEITDPIFSAQIDKVASLENIAEAMTNDFLNIDVLTVYLIGSSTNNEFLLNDTENLTTNVLNDTFRTFQADGGGDGSIYAFLEFSGAGSYIDAIKPDPGKVQLTVATSPENRKSILTPSLSFTSLFMTQIRVGDTIGLAAQIARRSIRRLSGNVRQKVLIDDNGNGLPNEKNIDGQYAIGKYFGFPFFTGAEFPIIEAYAPPIVLTDTTEHMLWAVVSPGPDDIAQVWCTVTTPSNYFESVTVDVDLVYNPTTGSYEFNFTDFQKPGLYTITYFAENNLGEVSEAIQSEVLQMSEKSLNLSLVHYGDTYEQDDTSEEATYSDLPAVQYHTLHLEDDCDWVKIWAMDTFIYDIETVHLIEGSSLDTVIRIYNEDGNGSLVLLDEIDEFGSESGELTGLDFPETGFYYIEVCSYPSPEWEPSAYVLHINIPAAPAGTMTIFAVDIVNRTYVSGSQATVGGIPAPLESSGLFQFSSPAIESYFGENVEVSVPNGYYGLFHPHRSSVGPWNLNSRYGNPRHIHSSQFAPIAFGDSLSSVYSYMGFYFIPHARITGTVEDNSGNILDNANIILQRASDIGSGQNVFFRYPWTEYGTDWASTGTGTFPANVYLPPSETYNLWVVREGYDTKFTPNAVVNPQRGQVYDLGTIELIPNTNPDTLIQGRVIEGFTGLPLKYVAIWFCQSCDTNCLNRYDGYYINGSPTSGSAWWTAGDGSFPGTVQLPQGTTDYYLRLQKPTVSGKWEETWVCIPPVLSDIPNSTPIDLGTFVLMPKDANGNTIPDYWEWKHYDTLILPNDQDTDNDGFTNYEEFVAGTNPRDASSVLMLHIENSDTLTLRLSWPVEPSRLYRLYSNTNLFQGTWLVESNAGPWETFGPSEDLEWLEQNLEQQPVKTYHIGVSFP